MRTIKFHKTDCGVDFLLRTGIGDELKEVYLKNDVYNTDYFEILIFKKAKGNLILNENSITISDNTIVFISPFQKRQWNLAGEGLDFTFLIFQEEFLNDFLADKLFSYRLLYFYQFDHPLYITASNEDVLGACGLLRDINKELKKTQLDSEQMIRSLVLFLLLKLNRDYAGKYDLPLLKPQNNYAYRFKKLLEEHIHVKQRIEDYSSLLQVSRITLNKAVQQQFGVTATHLIKQRLLFEVKNYLMHSNLKVSEIAYQLNFSEPNHLMRFFKNQTGSTTSEFLASYQNGSSS